MRYKILKILYFLAFSFCISGIINAQNYSFRNYGSEYGIPDGFVYSINQSNDGFLWVGTGNGLSRFDGFTYYNVPYPDSLENMNVTVTLKDSKGTLWFGCNNGAVMFSKGGKLEMSGISNSRSISQIVEGPDSLIYIVPQGNAIYSIDPANLQNIKTYNVSQDNVMLSAAFTAKGLLLVGVQGSIIMYRIGNDTLVADNIIDGFDYSGVSALATVDGSTFIAGTEDNGLFKISVTDEGNKVARFNGFKEWEALNVRSLIVDDEQKIWVSTFGNGAIEFRLNNDQVTYVRNYNMDSGLASNDVRLVFRDLEGNYWFALFGEGISMLSSYAFTFYVPGKNPSENNIIYIRNYREGYILGTPSGYHFFDTNSGKSLSFMNLSSATGGTILSYFLDDQQNLWIGTEGKGLYVKNLNGGLRSFYRSGDSGTDKINDIKTDGRYIWLATTNGLVVLDKNSGRVMHKFDTSVGLPHNSINKILLNDGNAYLGTESDRLYSIDEAFNIVPGNCLMSGSTINKILSFGKDSRGGIFSATFGNGIFECQGDSVSVINRANGLSSNYCYSVLCDSENDIWIGHGKGITRMNRKNRTFRNFGEDYSRKGMCNPGGLYESPDRNIFIGTTEGLIIYDRKADNIRPLPPFNNIVSITINDKEYNYQPLIELPYSKYRMTVRYSGINFSDPEKVYYQTYLENLDPDWSKMSLSREMSCNLNDGKYIFHLLSLDENELSQESLQPLIVIIGKPLYKKWWFILIVISLITGVIAAIFRQREKAQARIREYLETELEKRTSTIMKQKGEIELQNLEITDSINYAKRIQSSILPDLNKLRDSFNEAFIIFRPRDIVSGDFYWFDKIDDDKFIIVCADSTGHGVPGAFMSMIGSTLLQDIVTRKKISRPSQILGMLDKQIFSTLNQNVDLGVANDGMDMVVCEFSIKSRHVRFSSAMRPIILITSGESHYIKGNRSSVGGESVIEKYFIDQEYYLNEGDTIYLFSDGMPDQFGGTDGKKMKIARLKRVIDQISGLSMREQEQEMLKFIDEWKGSYEQVDDILLMGIRV